MYTFVIVVLLTTGSYATATEAPLFPSLARCQSYDNFVRVTKSSDKRIKTMITRCIPVVFYTKEQKA